MLMIWPMPNTDCFIQQKAGINQVVMLPSHSKEERRFGVWDGAIILGFLAAFASLLFLLAK